MVESAKVQRERQFHNERFVQTTDPRAPLDKWYASVRHGAELQNRLICDHATNKDVLEYGCADGGLSLHELDLCALCSTLTGIDISDVAIEKANAQAAALQVQNARFLTMNAEAMNFPDESFDLVFGRGILHHLDLKKCYAEISRVLKKNGLAIFSEPLGHNPLVNSYRSRTPDMRTPDEHPLLMDDLVLARRYFTRVDTTFYGLFSAASVFLDASCNGLPYRLSKALDAVVLRLPLLRRYAWHCLIVCRKTTQGRTTNRGLHRVPDNCQYIQTARGCPQCCSRNLALISDRRRPARFAIACIDCGEIAGSASSIAKTVANWDCIPRG